MFRTGTGTTGTGIADNAQDALTTEDRNTSSTAQSADGLFFQCCRWCGTHSFRRLLCPVCSSSDLSIERSEGRGFVQHSTVRNRGTASARNESLVRMAEGFLVRGRVLGPPAAIQAGDPVRLSTLRDPVDREITFQLIEEPRLGV